MARWPWLAPLLMLAAPAAAHGPALRPGTPAAGPPAQGRSTASRQRAAWWVMLRDESRSPEALSEALERRAAELSPHALARRLRVRDGATVDRRDLGPSAYWVAAVLDTGARLRVVSRWLNAVSVSADEPALTAITRLPFVHHIEPVRARRRRAVQPSGSPPEPPPMSPLDTAGPHSFDYGLAATQLELIGVPALHDCGLTGAGVIVAVLDTGFVIGHQAFATLQVMAAHDFINDDEVVHNEPGDPGAQHNHGTSVLSLLAGSDDGNYCGVAPDVTVILAKTEDVSLEQPIEEDWFVAGLEWAEALGADVVTASLGYVDWYQPADLDGATAVSSKAARIAIDNGVIMVSAAGNWGPNPTTIGAPADTDGLIAVGAVDETGQLAGFSSRGPTADDRFKPDVCAMGVQSWVVDPSTTDGYQQGNGTSYATPMVAGLVALLLQAYPESTPEQIYARLTSTASQAQAPDNDMGYGLLAGPDAVGLYCTCHDADADGFFDTSCGGADCDDTNGAVHPNATEICSGRDDDCDGDLLPGEADDDGDGYPPCAGDCDDQDVAVSPGASEICDDGLDNDCNGATDEADEPCKPEPPPPTTPSNTPNEEGGCGCRLTPSPLPLGWAALWWLLGACLWRRLAVLFFAQPATRREPAA